MKPIKIKDNEQLFSEIRLVVFQFPDDPNDLRFGVNTHKVREVIEFNQVEKLPALYAPYVGVINLRGIPVPLLDISRILSGSDFGAKNIFDPENRILVCETLGRLIGIVASKSIKIEEFRDIDMKPANFETKNGGKSFLNGLVEHNEGYIYTVNIEEILEEYDVADDEKNIAPKAVYRGRHVLVVEDSRLYRKKLQKYFEQLGFKVSTANDGLQGLDFLKTTKGLDLIFSDIEMPGLNGIEMIRKIKALDLCTGTPIVFHSSISNEGLIEQIRTDDLGIYICKFDEELILSCLQDLFSVEAVS